MLIRKRISRFKYSARFWTGFDFLKTETSDLDLATIA